MSKCKIHVKETEVFVSKRITLPNGSRTSEPLDIGQVCTICLEAVWKCRQEAVK